ncbi:uncharacterized protein [Montipora capricornis]|uniref:uncharacterized protein n=1 Tax=Montipora capricornis TaxID=246305 RepID=UPI0035F1EC53
MRTAVDILLRDQQAGFRKDRSCIDQICALLVIIEQSLEWNVNFVHYEKAFHSVDRETLRKLLHFYGIPKTFVTLIKFSYEGNNGIQWISWKQLEDLDYADDLPFLFHNHLKPQDKTSRLAEESAKLGLRINKVKTKVLRINTTSEVPVVVEGQLLENVKKFPYLVSVVDTLGDTDKDALTRIGKARAVFIMLKKSSSVIEYVEVTNGKWFSVVCTLIDNDIRHHSG